MSHILLTGGTGLLGEYLLRDLTREGIVNALESLDDFHPGLAPALSYSEDRRIGSVGVHIVPVDLVEDRFTEPVRWIVPRDP